MKTLEQVRREGFEALLKQLGPVGTVRFKQYEFGQGDYTCTRAKARVRIETQQRNGR